MYKLEVKLKQYTPLIHFQWEQKGATLRASEVKPKLDRFVLEKLVEKKGEEYIKGKECYEKEKKEEVKEFEALEMFKKAYWIGKAYGWLIGESKALDYKVRIKSSGERTELNKLPMYFGDTDKKGVSYDQELDLTISSFYNEIIELLKRYLSEFFFCYNFGCRQSKGYGGFEVFEMNEGYNQKMNVKFENFYTKAGSNTELIQINLKLEQKNDFWELFSFLDLYYKSIRGGINLKDKLYCKPILYYWAKENKWEWEKRYIKRNLLIDDYSFCKWNKKNENWDSENGKGYDSQEIDDKNINDFPSSYLIRDLLGFSSYVRWNSYAIEVKKEEITEEEKTAKDNFRLSSPFLLKVYTLSASDHRIFLIKNRNFTDKTWGKLTGKEFNIKVKPITKNIQWVNGKRPEGQIMLSFPKQDKIYDDIYKKIKEFWFEDFNIETKYTNSEEYKKLEFFFKSIVRNES